MDKSYLTAIYRKSLSAPTKYLYENNLLVGRVLDYGCGKGFDSKHLNIESYDIYYQPKLPSGKFDTIICNYVLNVIRLKKDRDMVVNHIRSLLKKNGKAYIAVNRKMKWGKTKRGTYQVLVDFDLPIIHQESWYVIYELNR